MSNYHDDIRMRFDRSYGELELAIVTPTSGPAYVALRARARNGTLLGNVALKADELAQCRSALTECENVLRGHPRHRANGDVDEVLQGKQR